MRVASERATVQMTDRLALNDRTIKDRFRRPSPRVIGENFFLSHRPAQDEGPEPARANTTSVVSVRGPSLTHSPCHREGLRERGFNVAKVRRSARTAEVGGKGSVIRHTRH